MKTTIDYTGRTTPNFDAVEDIKFYLGSFYDAKAELMKEVKSAQAFDFFCSFMGIAGLPVRAWYDHFNGEGAYEKWWAEYEKDQLVKGADLSSD